MALTMLIEDAENVLDYVEEMWKPRFNKSG